MRVGEGIAVGHGMRRVVRMFIPLVVGLFCCSAVLLLLTICLFILFLCFHAALLHLTTFLRLLVLSGHPNFNFISPHVRM